MSSDWVKSNIDGVYIDRNVAVEWDELGANIAGESSTTQAMFLEEFVNGLHKLGALDGAMQLQYIVDAFRESWEEDRSGEEVRRMRWFLTTLLEGIDAE